jgi:hypothetical protein
MCWVANRSEHHNRNALGRYACPAHRSGSRGVRPWNTQIILLNRPGFHRDSGVAPEVRSLHYCCRCRRDPATLVGTMCAHLRATPPPPIRSVWWRDRRFAFPTAIGSWFSEQLTRGVSP